MARNPELWCRIRNDFLATGASYSTLAKKYGVSLSKVKHVAAKEMWTSGGIEAINLAEKATDAARSMQTGKVNRSEPIEPIPSEPTEPIEPPAKSGQAEPEREPAEEPEQAPAPDVVREATEILAVTPTAIQDRRDRYQRFMEITDSMMDRIAEALASPEVINPYSLKLLASALRDIREMQGLNKSELDREEQRMRIAKLKREADNQIRMDEVFTVEFVDTEGAEV